MAKKPFVRTNPQKFGDSTTANIDPAGKTYGVSQKTRPGIRTPENPTRSIYARKDK